MSVFLAFVISIILTISIVICLIAYIITNHQLYSFNKKIIEIKHKLNENKRKY